MPIDELNTLRSELTEIVRSVVAESERYDSIDFLIDLLAAAVIPIVEEHLEAEYDQAFESGIDGWIDASPNETDRTDAVYAEVDGKSFADRIEEYASGDLNRFVDRVQMLVETDGHRVRSEAKLDAGENLVSAGLTVRKTWRGVMDERERDVHVALEGVTLPLDGLFEINGFKAPAPGLFFIPEYDCGCRCELQISVAG